MPHRIVPHLSPARLALYRAECKSNSDHRAGALYAWQIELHAAWYEVLGLVEMLLRHSLDNALGNWNHASPLPGGGTREWLVSAAKPLSSLSAKMARDARTEAQKVAKRRSRQHPRYGVTPTHDDFVAQLTFGNLAHLLPTKAAPTKRSTRSSPVRWCTTSSRDSSSVGQAVKAGVTSSVSSVTLSVGVSVRERASTSSPR